MNRWFLLPLTSVWLCVAPAQIPEPGSAETTAATDEATELTERFRRQAHEMMKEYKFTLPEQSETEVQFRSQPLMTWTNPIAGNWEGVVYMWTAQGRPAVIGSPLHHSDRRKMAHQFHSLLESPVMAHRDGNVVWNTRDGVQWKPLPNADEPKTTGHARALQMRRYARRFTVQKVFPDALQRELRLLPKYVYRSETQDGQDVVDGACFVFTQSTDPNVVLLLEARRSKDALQWHYALARLNQFELIVAYDKEEVFRFPFVPFPERSSRSSPYTKFFNQMYSDEFDTRPQIPAAE